MFLQKLQLNDDSLTRHSGLYMFHKVKPREQSTLLADPCLIANEYNVIKMFKKRIRKKTTTRTSVPGCHGIKTACSTIKLFSY